MKKLIIGAICIILLTGCGSKKQIKKADWKTDKILATTSYHQQSGWADSIIENKKYVIYTKQVEQQVENNANLQKTYQEKEFDLGFQNKTAVKLESNDEKNLFLKIDEESINLSEEKDLYFNFDFCKLKAKDFDADGIKEILVLFYGGAGGTFQDFCMVKYDGVKWMSVPCDWEPDEDADNIKLGKGQQLRYRYFKAGKNNIDISYDVYEDGKEEAVKKVHVKIYFNKKKTKLCVQFQN